MKHEGDTHSCELSQSDNHGKNDKPLCENKPSSKQQTELIFNPKGKPKTVVVYLNKIATEAISDYECSTNVGMNSTKNVEFNSNNNNDDDDMLPEFIKVEPPDIKDIDGDEQSTSAIEDNSVNSPKLVIDMPEDHSNETVSSTMKINTVSKPIPPADKLQKEDFYKIIDKRKKSQSWYRNSRVPRPPNAFMIFANEWRRQLSSENPMESNKDISVRLGVMWKNLTTESKELYYKASRKADEDHKEKFPGYYYSPKEARMRKNLKLKKRKNFEMANLNDGTFRFVKVVMDKEDNNKISTSTTSVLKSERAKRRKIDKKEIKGNKGEIIDRKSFGNKSMSPDNTITSVAEAPNDNVEESEQDNDINSTKSKELYLKSIVDKVKLELNKTLIVSDCDMNCSEGDPIA